MIDHLIRCASAGEAEALIEEYSPARAHAVRVILADAEWNMTDPENPVLATPELLASGHHVWIALEAVDVALRQRPEHSCRLIADRAAALAGDPGFMLYLAADIGPETIEAARIEPVPAGSGYPFRAI